MSGAEVRGRPIHSRTLDVEAWLRDDGHWDVRAEIVDLRKAGFVPIAGDLQMAGLLHHMQLRGSLDPGTGVLTRIEAHQPAVAFEPSALTGGESCRDPAPAVAALAGRALDGGFARHVSAAIGGPRGCSHVLALARLTGSTLARALAREGARGAGAQQGAARRAGERVVRRSLSLDGLQPEEGSLDLALQLTEVHFAPAPPVARPLARLAALAELRGRARVGLPGLELTGLELAECGRGPEDLERADWRDLSGELAELSGGSLAAGFGSRVLRLLEGRPPGDPAVDALLQLGPGALQCLASLTEPWPARAARDPSTIVCAGPTDSCYMWRRTGALERVRRREGKGGTT